MRAYYATHAVRVHGENYMNKMIGHAGYLMEYDRYDDSKKLEMYLKLEPSLLVYENFNEDFDSMSKRIRELEQQNTMNEMAIKSLMSKDPRFRVEMAQFALKENLSDKIKASEEDLKEVIKKAQKQPLS